MSYTREIQRQGLHVLLGIILASLLWLHPIMPYFFLLLTGFFIVMTFLTQTGYRVYFYSSLLDYFERDKEKNSSRAQGFLSFLFGVTLVSLLFPTLDAFVAILILAFGDAIATIVGFPRKKNHPFHKGKNLEASVLAIAVGTFVAAFFVPFLSALLATTIAMCVESIDFKAHHFMLNDNVIIPLVAASILYLL